ncbi:MAG: GntR family transcriptional regulator [Erysipelotrichaceae bacterium]|nr:GntR family transcriptional regulator [Erysipelotrichaceae bacterium]MDY5251176.1 GntR family transcriptional regulator [Erysipelotrichaceae bacterium]
MTIEFKDNIPIYLQIVEDIKMKIMANKLKVGDKLSSVRELAMIYGVNPNTVQKALSELERASLVKAERTAGRYICATPEQIKDLKDQVAKAKVEEFMEAMQDLGYEKKEIMMFIERSKTNDGE